MNFVIRLAKFALTVALVPVSSAAELTSGAVAPAFRLLDQNADEHRFDEYQGKCLVSMSILTMILRAVLPKSVHFVTTSTYCVAWG